MQDVYALVPYFVLGIILKYPLYGTLIWFVLVPIAYLDLTIDKSIYDLIDIYLT